MRVLLDENLNWRLVRYFDADCQVTTVDRQGWKGKRNGELLEQAAETFDVLVTMIKNIEYQQDIREYAIGVIIISARSNRQATTNNGGARRPRNTMVHLIFCQILYTPPKPRVCKVIGTNFGPSIVVPNQRYECAFGIPRAPEVLVD